MQPDLTYNKSVERTQNRFAALGRSPQALGGVGFGRLKIGVENDTGRDKKRARKRRL